jgi:hypothetical protein
MASSVAASLSSSARANARVASGEFLNRFSSEAMAMRTSRVYFLMVTLAQGMIVWGFVTRSTELVEVRDSEGRVLARIPAAGHGDEIAEAKRRLASDQPRYTSQQVQSHLQALTDAVEREGLDDNEARALLERLQTETR